MRESRSCGSVRAEGSNALGYSEILKRASDHYCHYFPYLLSIPRQPDR